MSSALAVCILLSWQADAVTRPSRDFDTPARTLEARAGPDFRLVLSADGKTLVAGPAEHDSPGGGPYSVRLIVWDTTTWQQKCELAHDGKLLTISPDGKIVVTVNMKAELELWATASGEHVRASARQPHLHLPTNAFFDATFSPNGRILATVGPRFVHLWDTSLVSRAASIHDSVRLWDVGSLKKLQSIETSFSHRTRLAFSPDGKLLAIVPDSNGQARLWDVEKLREIYVLGSPGQAVLCAAFSPDGNVLATGARDGKVGLWDVLSGEQIGAMSIEDPGGDAVAVAFSPDGKTLAIRLAIGQKSSLVVLREVTSGREVRRLKTYPCYSDTVAFLPSGDRLITAGPTGVVAIWNFESPSTPGEETN